MPAIENIVTYMVMACALLGALAAIRDPEEGLGEQFMEGLHSIGPIFIPVAGIMAAVPYLAQVVERLLGPAFSTIGADPSIAAATLIAVDMGGYNLADAIAATREDWIMAMIVGYMAGATMIFSIPVGLAMLKKSDHKYMALGIMSGVLSIPIGVVTACVLVMVTGISVRPEITTDKQSALRPLQLTMDQILSNVSPLVLFVALVAIGLRFRPDDMIRGFIVFGRTVDAFIKLVLVASIVEYFTGGFTILFRLFGAEWGFDPIIADSNDQFRALEIAGYIGIMLAGAFPMVYLIRNYLAGPVEAVGRSMGLNSTGAAGFLATVANVLAMYKLVEDMRPRDKVINIAFSVCAAFLLGDHLAFTANFQPTLIFPVIAGKLVGGTAAIGLAIWLSVPKALELAAHESESPSANHQTEHRI